MNIKRLNEIKINIERSKGGKIKKFRAYYSNLIREFGKGGL